MPSRKPAPAAANSRKSRVNEQAVSGAKKEREQDKKSRDRRRLKTSESATLSFDYCLTEGNTYQSNGDFSRAVAGYSKGLDLKPDHRVALLSRSHCYLQLGDTRSALTDANKLLADDSKSIKGIQQKADVLYQMAEFEQALVLYHRGHKLRPEIHAFPLGIQLCHGAIDNCIGDKSGIHLNKTGDLSFFTEQLQTKESREKRQVDSQRQDSKQQQQQQQRTVAQQSVDDKTMKQLLEQLYTDKQYLEQLLHETERVHSKSTASEQVCQLSTAALNYLDTRATFWQQKEPPYSRQRNKHLQSRSQSSTPDSSGATQWILDNLRAVDDEQSAGRYEASLDRATRVLKRVVAFSERQVERRAELMAHLHSYSGNAQLELQRLDDALWHHQQDLDIAKQHNLPDAVSRASDNIGRVLVRQHKYRPAIALYSERSANTRHPLERTWLQHEIGRCYLELNDARKALEFGEMSLNSANEAGDALWQLNASVLMAQAHVKLRQYSESIEAFERSRDLARSAADEHAVDAIETAMRDVEQRRKQQTQSDSDDDSHQQQQQQQQRDEAKDDVSSDEVDTKPAPAPAPAPATAASVTSPAPPTVQQDTTSYTVTVRVSDVEDAGSDVTLYAELTGARGETRRVELESDKTRRLNRGQETQFTIKAIDVGQIEKLLLGHSSAVPGSGAHIALVHVHSQATGQTQTFYCNQWLDKAFSDKRIERLLTPTGNSNKGSLVKYEVVVKTSEESGSGTDANVFIQLLGNEGETERIALDKSLTQSNKFENGQTDEFQLQAPPVGQVRSIRIGHDSANLAAAWRLDDVTVTYDGATVRFPADRWLDKSQGDGRTEVQLLAAE